MTPPSSVTIVGASLAGLRAAESLRRRGHDGPIRLLGAEEHLPYDRPPLSKQVLAGEWEPDRIVLADAAKLADLGVDWRPGCRVRHFDLASRRLDLADGSTESVDALVIATGATPRRLPGTDGLGGVHVVRTVDDALALRADLDAGPGRVLVVGAGFIGAEVAATCRARGHEVTLVEALEVPLARVLGPRMGAVCGELHRDHGVDLRCGVAIDGVDGDDRVERVRLADGTRLEVDVVVVGVGVVPATGWLEGSGLTIDDGVVCDATGLAAPGVVAAGDVARWPDPRAGHLVRVEHWDNAVRMGAHVGARLLVDDGEAEPYAPVPVFWSDQYDRKIQLAGHVRPDDEVRVVVGSTAERRFVALYGRAGRLVGVLAVNRPRHLMAYSALIERGVSFDEALVAEV